MNTVLQTLSSIGLIPVIAIDDAAAAPDLCAALDAGGLPAAEITFRTAAGQEAIRRVAAQCPDILVGAGTVLNTEQCLRAIDAGAKYIVCPGYNDAVVELCLEKGVPVLPGCTNASDMTKAVNAGLEAVKFFPAEQSGGIAFLRSMMPVFPLRFMPTGGINAKNMMDYLSNKRVMACGGSFMVKSDLIKNKKWDEISSICKDAVAKMLDFKLEHVGINCDGDEDARQAAALICEIFGFELKNGSGSYFSGTAVECMKNAAYGTCGHIAIATADINRAVFQLRRKGFAFREETLQNYYKGLTQAVYLEKELGGFAIHLFEK